MKTIQKLLIESLGRDKVLIGDELANRYHHIWRMSESLNAVALIMPTSTDEVSKILKICHEHNQPVIAFGGLTNLVGGTETTGNEVIISTEKLNQIEEVDPMSRTITVQSGVILEEVQQEAAKHDLLFPLNFGAKGTARIGGVIASNAGGLRVFRYGMTRSLVLGVEAVLADGTIISSMKKIIKDNSAYDLKQLFVGSEGTLGVITKAVLKLVEAPKSRASAFVAMNEFDQVVSFLKHMDGGLGGILSGYELMWDNYYTLATTAPALSKPPIPQGYKYYVLIEALGSDLEKDKARIEALAEEAFTKGIIEEAVFANTHADLDWFWKIREDVHAVVSQMKHDQHFDISLPIPLIGNMVDDMLSKLHSLEGVGKVISFGHIADGNIHFVVEKEHLRKQLTEAINDIIYGPLMEVGGSVSAEHGIGLHKKAYLKLCRTEAEIGLMKQIKKTMDPKGILNPGKVF